MPSRRVIWDENDQKSIIKELHDNSGHRGKKGTYQKIALMYQWKGLYRDVETWVKTCEECQFGASNRMTEELHPTLENTLWSKVGLDVVYMLKDAGFSKIVAIRDYLSGWLEAKAIKSTDSQSVAPFVFDWISRFGLMGQLVYDNGAENKGLTQELITSYWIKNVQIASYHSQANGLVERGHQPVLNALSKLGKKRIKNLPLVVWADSITTRASTGYASDKLVFGQECVLPVELRAASQAVIAWEKVRTLEDLLVAHARQLERKEEDILTARERIWYNRIKNKVLFDKGHCRRKEILKVGDLVLLHNTVLNKQWSKKLDNRWLGPYLIKEVWLDLGTYLWSELDGTGLNGVYAQYRLKKFFQPDGIELDENDAESEQSKPSEFEVIDEIEDKEDEIGRAHV